MKPAAESKKQLIGKKLIRSSSLHSLIFSSWLHLVPGLRGAADSEAAGARTLSQQVFVSVDTATDQPFHSMARAHGAGDRASSIICNWDPAE